MGGGTPPTCCPPKLINSHHSPWQKLGGPQLLTPTGAGGGPGGGGGFGGDGGDGTAGTHSEAVALPHPATHWTLAGRVATAAEKPTLLLPSPYETPPYRTVVPFDTVSWVPSSHGVG